jgi:UDP-glucose 4-epimerase
MVAGFDPLFQFIHDEDAAGAIVKSLETGLRGVYNVAGPQPLPLSVLIKQARRTAIPVPEPILRAALGRFGLPRLPRAAIAHLKYPVVVDDSLFRATTGWTHEYDEDRTIADFRDAAEHEPAAT